MLGDLRSGPACLLDGYRLLLKPGLRRFVLLPALGGEVYSNPSESPGHSM